MEYPIFSLTISFMILAVALLCFDKAMHSRDKIAQPILIDAQLIQAEEKPISNIASSKSIHRINKTPPQPLSVKSNIKTVENTPAATEQEQVPKVQTHTTLETSSAKIVYNPLPNIPDELRNEAFNSEIIARFHISSNGLIAVELIKPSFNPKLNRILLQELRTWKLLPARENGIAIDSVKDIRVNFSVR